MSPPPPPTPVQHEPDLWLIHDSIGHGIKPGIMSRYNLSTAKVTAYTQEEAKQAVKKIKGNPRAVILHVGTNDIKNKVDADVIIKGYEDLRKLVAQKLPKTQLIISNIVPRTDNLDFQRNVEYINAAVNRKYANSNNVSIVGNQDITGRKLKALDGIHLTEPAGVSRLASHIKDVVLAALDIE